MIKSSSEEKKSADLQGKREDPLPKQQKGNASVQKMEEHYKNISDTPVAQMNKEGGGQPQSDW